MSKAAKLEAWKVVSDSVHCPHHEVDKFKLELLLFSFFFGWCTDIEQYFKHTSFSFLRL